MQINYEMNCHNRCTGLSFMCVKLKHAKFQPSSARGTFSNWRLNGKGGLRIMCRQEIRLVRWDGNHWPRMKVTDNQYGRLS